MNKCREEAIQMVIVSLQKRRDAFLRGDRGCGFECSAIMFGVLTKRMLSSALISPEPTAPFLGLKYKDLVNTVRSFKTPQWSHPHRRHQHSCSDSSFRYWLGTKDDVEGLDLDCFF